VPKPLFDEPKFLFAEPKLLFDEIYLDRIHVSRVVSVAHLRPVHKLNEGRIIKPDSALKAVFPVASLDMLKMAGFVSKHLS